MRLPSSNNRPWYKEPWPWILMSGPAIVVVAGIATAWLAIRSNDGLVTEDYYKQGLAINQQLQREHKAADLGLHGDVVRSGKQIRVMIAGGASISMPDKLVLRITHPTRAGMDQTVALAAEGAGLFSGKLAADVSGRWHVVLEDPSGQWRLHGDWQADTEESLRLLSGETATDNNRNASGG